MTLQIKCEKIQQQVRQTWPNQRLKSSCCLVDNKLLVCGGDRNGTKKLDLWVYQIDLKIWSSLDSFGDVPPNLRGHSMHYDEKSCLVYTFGGSFSRDTSFWTFNLKTKYWKKQSSIGPENRRNHESVLTDDGNLHVFGGYIDLKGSTNEHWIYSLSNKGWILLNDKNISPITFPEARHDFGCATYEDDWWIFGGSKDLICLNDLWTFTFSKQQWVEIKMKTNIPPEISGHKLIRLNSMLIVIGGRRKNNKCLLTFNLKTLKWKSTSIDNEKLPNFLNHCAICLNNDSLKFKNNKKNLIKSGKIQPNDDGRSKEYISQQVFINRAFSTEFINNSHLFETRKFLLPIVGRNDDMNLILSDINDEDDFDNITNLDMKYVKNTQCQIIVFGGTNNSQKYGPLTMWQLTLFN